MPGTVLVWGIMKEIKPRSLSLENILSNREINSKRNKSKLLNMLEGNKSYKKKNKSRVKECNWSCNSK